MCKFVCSCIAVVAIFLVLSGCSSSRQVAYFQNAGKVDLAPSKGLYDARIMPKDVLTITVSTTNPAAAAPFNLSAAAQSTYLSTNLNSEQKALLPYLVDNNGDIDFPIIGKLHVLGKTKTECENLIKEKIMPYLAKTENPIVTVRMSSYRVTVMGEVNNPGVIPVSSEKMSILEALASAGDLTIYGKRTNVMLIREDAKGEKCIYRLNLNDANLINSPYYYLQQNDVLYVQPNGVKSKSAGIGQSTNIWFSLVSIATSVASLIVTILR